jgi:hypothetical protein
MLTDDAVRAAHDSPERNVHSFGVVIWIPVRGLLLTISSCHYYCKQEVFERKWDASLRPLVVKGAIKLHRFADGR